MILRAKLNSLTEILKILTKKCLNKELKKDGWSLATENNGLDLCLGIFFHLFSKTLDKHAPLKQGIRKDNKN